MVTTECNDKEICHDTEQTSRKVSANVMDVVRKDLNDPSVIHNFEINFDSRDKSHVWSPSSLLQIPWKIYPFDSVTTTFTNEKSTNEFQSRFMPSWNLNTLRETQNLNFAETQLREGIRHARTILSSTVQHPDTKKSHTDKAEYYYKEGLKAYPDHVPTLLAYGALCCNNQTSPDQVQKGKDLWKHVLRLDPGNKSALQYLDAVRSREEKKLKQKQNGTIRHDKMNITYNLNKHRDVLAERALAMGLEVSALPNSELDALKGKQTYSLIPDTYENLDYLTHRQGSKSKQRRRKSKSSRKSSKRRNYCSETETTSTDHSDDEESSISSMNSSYEKKRRKRRSSSNKNEQSRRRRKSSKKSKKRRKSTSRHRRHRSSRERHETLQNSIDQSSKGGDNDQSEDDKKDLKIHKKNQDKQRRKRKRRYSSSSNSLSIVNLE